MLHKVCLILILLSEAEKFYCSEYLEGTANPSDPSGTFSDPLLAI